MPNLMDSTPFNNVSANSFQSPEAIINQIKQNPAMFEEYVRKNNPQAYQKALQIRNSHNPRAAILQMVQASGLNPNILSMFGLK